MNIFYTFKLSINSLFAYVLSTSGIIRDTGFRRVLPVEIAG